MLTGAVLMSLITTVLVFVVYATVSIQIVRVLVQTGGVDVTVGTIVDQMVTIAGVLVVVVVYML